MQHNPRSQQREDIKRELKKYSLSELKDICHHFGVNYEDLPGATNGSRRDIIRELHMHMERQSDLAEFLDRLRFYSRQQTPKKQKKSRPRKTKEEKHTEMAQKLHKSIFIPLKRILAYSLLGSITTGFILASFIFYYGYPAYDIARSFLFGFIFIPLLFVIDIFATNITSTWIKTEARKKNFYDLTVLDREHSKDKLHELLKTRHKFPAGLFLLSISTLLLRIPKDRK